MDIPLNPNAARPSASALLCFGPFALDRASHRLTKGGQAVRIGSRAFGLLVDLLESAGQLRTREQLEARVWPHSVVEETSLRVHMSALRRALGDGRDGVRYISNVPGRGYSFIGTVTRQDAFHAIAAGSPAHDHALAGREDALRTLGQHFKRTRLLSIVGPGGIGKTALAVALAGQMQRQYADGVVHADLSAAVSAPCVVAMLASAAALHLPAQDSLAALCAMLEQDRRLFVLDDCDRAIDGAAAVAMALLQRCPGLHILVTTREPLDVQGETVYWLDGLHTPQVSLADPAEAMRYAAVRLFVERARASDGRFVLDSDNVGDVCRLCRHLDGIPLAIELAAARVEALGVASLAGGLGDLLGLLTRSRRTALPRHRAMAAALAWSVELLSAEERAVFCRSGVFQADFSIDAARAVCADGDGDGDGEGEGEGESEGGIDGDTVARCVESLAAKSLLVRNKAGGASLYRLLQLTRSYVLDLLPADEKLRLARRHASHVASLLAASASAPVINGSLPWLAAHGGTFDDCRAALDWAFSGQGDRALGVGMIPNLIRTLRFLGMPDDFRQRLLLALDDRAANEARGASALAPEAAISIYAALAVLGAYSHTGFDVLRDILARLHGLLARVESPVLRIEALLSMGAAAYSMGEAGLILEIVRTLRAQTLLNAQSGAAAHLLIADRLESGARHLRAEHAPAAALCHQILQMNESASSLRVSCPTPGSIGARWNLARIAWIRGKPELAAQLAHEALAHAGQQHTFVQCQTLVIVALPVALWRGDDAHAAQLIARLHALAASARSQYWQDWARGFEAAWSRRRGGPFETQAAPRCPAELAPIVQDILATLDAGMAGPFAFARAEAGTIGWCAAEVWRARAVELTHQNGADCPQAAALFVRALALAREQQALGWELRIARSLLQSWRGGPRTEEGIALLGAVLARFDEGLDTADCRAAAAELAAP